jgi:hypothetical protein
MARSAATSIRRHLRLQLGEHRYGVVLAVILCTLVFQLAAPESGWARLVAIGLQGLALLAALAASKIHPYLMRLAFGIVAIAIVTSSAALIGFGALGATAARMVTLLLVALAPAAIARGVVVTVRERGGVSLHTMFGVLCIYLLIGSLFAFGFAIVDHLASTPFFAAGVHADTSDFLYFSFATMTTVGYGDLTAVTDLGRSLAIFEALIGQIYMVTVVAVIVGGLSRRPA